MSEQLELRPEVLAFAQLMERRLQDDAWKDGDAATAESIRSKAWPYDFLGELRDAASDLEQEMDMALGRQWRDWDPATHRGGGARGNLLVYYDPDKGWQCACAFAARPFEPTPEGVERMEALAAAIANWAMRLANRVGSLK